MLKMVKSGLMPSNPLTCGTELCRQRKMKLSLLPHSPPGRNCSVTPLSFKETHPVELPLDIPLLRLPPLLQEGEQSNGLWSIAEGSRHVCSSEHIGICSGPGECTLLACKKKEKKWRGSWPIWSWHPQRNRVVLSAWPVWFHSLHKIARKSGLLPYLNTSSAVGASCQNLSVFGSDLWSDPRSNTEAIIEIYFVGTLNRQGKDLSWWPSRGLGWKWKRSRGFQGKVSLSWSFILRGLNFSPVHITIFWATALATEKNRCKVVHILILWQLERTGVAVVPTSRHGQHHWLAQVLEAGREGQDLCISHYYKKVPLS